MRAQRAEDLLCPAVRVFSTVLPERALELVDREFGENARKPNANLPSAFQQWSPHEPGRTLFYMALRTLLVASRAPCKKDARCGRRVHGARSDSRAVFAPFARFRDQSARAVVT